jgi:hypothetical protein
MSEPTKALLLIIGVIAIPTIGYVLYLFLKEHYLFKNAIHVDFKKRKGKVKGYVKNKNGEWSHDDSLHLEDEADLKDEHQ